MMRVAIIGAGLSGRLLAFNLCRQASGSVSVRLIDRSESTSLGPAYSSDGDWLLLNIPACRMSARSDAPHHFVEWVRAKGVEARDYDFLPRRLYREYVLALYEEAQREGANGAELARTRADVKDVEIVAEGVAIHTDDERIVADKVILAFGNFPPRDPPTRNRTVLSNERYVRDPWRPGALDRVSRNDSVLLLGTAQTAVDVAITLHEREHVGRIVAMSRRGLLPWSHTTLDAYPSFVDEVAAHASIREMLRVVREHVERARLHGIDARAVVDALRPAHQQRLWQLLSDAEKRRFLRHVCRHWESIRGRIPTESDAIVRTMLASGQLRLVAGRVADVSEVDDAIRVRFTRRGATTEDDDHVAHVINCTGPELEYDRIDDALVRSLLRRGLIRPGPAGLGIDGLPTGEVIDREGRASSALYTLGSPLKGVLWASLAVPEIRVQAERLAERVASRAAG